MRVKNKALSSETDRLGAWLISFALLIKGINGAFLSPPTPEVPGFKSSGGGGKGRLAGLQASSKFPAAPATFVGPSIKKRLRNAQSRFQTLQDRGTATRSSRRLPHYHQDQHTHASDSLLTGSLESSRGERSGSCAAPAPPHRRVSCRDPDVTRIMDSGLQRREAESCPTASGDPAWRGRGPVGQGGTSALRPPQKRGEAE